MKDRIYIYHTSPNQKTVITRKTVSDRENTYGISNVDATLSAAKSLTDRAFKLYARMNLHQDGHTYALSPVEILNSIGMSEKKYREAVKELIEKKYLVETERKGVYYFYEHQQCGNEDCTQNEKWEDAPSDFGESYTTHRADPHPVLEGLSVRFGGMPRPFGREK